MKKHLLIASVMLMANATQAQFSGPYAAGNWSTYRSDVGHSSSVTHNGTASISFNLPADVADSRILSYSITLPATGNVSFDFAVTGDAALYEFGVGCANTIVGFAGIMFQGVGSGHVDLATDHALSPQAGQSLSFYVAEADQGFIGATTLTISNFSAAGAIPTPILLSAFSGVARPSGNMLSWSTATEMGVDFFAVERSTDGKSFQTVDRVKSCGPGSTYRITDPLTNADALYRLRVQDISGEATYSHTIRIGATGDVVSKGRLFPNPATNVVTYSNPQAGTDAVVMLSDLTGKVLRQQIMDGGAVSFHTADLPAGLYTIQCKDAQRSEVLKFQKQ